MSIDVRLLDILEKRKRADLQQNAAPTGTGDGGEPPRDDGIERRISSLEASVISIDRTLAVMSEQLKQLASREELAVVSTKLDGKASAADFAALSGRLDRMASATDLAELKGRVARIPTVPVLTSILVFVSLLFAAIEWAFRHLPDPWSRALQ